MTLSKILTVCSIAFLIWECGCASSDQKRVLSENDGLRLKLEKQRTRDLRTLFRPEEIIEALERRRACSVGVGMIQAPPREVFVGDGQTLDWVIIKFMGHEYDGQIKVISRDSIVQTPRATFEPGQQKTIQVHPGDLIFVQGRD